jgi:HPr kinase/phosphorylase
MDNNKSVHLAQIVDEFGLEIICRGSDYDDALLTIEDVNRPGLQFVGFFDYFDPRRLQVIGKAEITFLAKMSSEKRRESFEGLLSYDIPALVISRGMDVFPECLEMAEKYGRTLLRTQDTTVVFTSKMIDALNKYLAPSITRHGVLVEIYGEGVLLLGESGVGKSETAIELVKRGHRLIADDAVEIRRVANTLMGTAPKLIRHYIELRGIGVVDVRQLFGMSAIKIESQIDLIINLEPWKEGYPYDRLGLDDQYMSIMGINIAALTVPVQPGRNLAVIIEVAAMNNRHKKLGYNAAQEFTNQINKHFDEELGKQK